MKPDDLPMYPTPQQATYTIPPQSSSSSRRHASGGKPPGNPYAQNSSSHQNSHQNGYANKPYQPPPQQYYQPQHQQPHQQHQPPQQHQQPQQNQHYGNQPQYQPQYQRPPQNQQPSQYGNGYVDAAPPPLHPSQNYYHPQAQPVPIPSPSAPSHYNSSQYGSYPNGSQYQQPQAPAQQGSRHTSSSLPHTPATTQSPPQMNGMQGTGGTPNNGRSHPKKQSYNNNNRSRENIEEPKVSSKQRLEAELRATFERVDVNRSGRISTKELSSALMNFDNTGFQISTVRLMMKLFTSSSSSSSSSLNFEQFVSLWKYLSAYKKLFVAADVNKSGDISFGEFQRIIEQIGYKLNVDLVLHLFQKFANREANDDGTVAVGKLKFDAFIELLVYLRKLTDIFKQFDKDLTGVATVEYSDFLYEISNLT